MKSLISAVLLLGSGTAYAASTDTVNVEARVVEIHMTRKEAVVEESKKARIEKFDGHATCSGEFIDLYGDILTARHCVEGFTEFEVVTDRGEKFIATVTATSPVHDLALIHIDHLTPNYFTLAESVARGEHISVLGSPLGITNTLSVGVVAKLAGDMLLIDCGALPGNSGGPVFNDKGELVGVVVAGYIVGMGTTHLNMAQGLESVLFFLTNTFKHH